MKSELESISNITKLSLRRITFIAKGERVKERSYNILPDLDGESTSRSVGSNLALLGSLMVILATLGFEMSTVSLSLVIAASGALLALS